MVYSYPFRLMAILILKAFLMIGVILYSGIGLGPDEAQYWTWSQALDWGYYSKPPGIAWQIRLGTSLFGNTELGVRFVSLLLSFLQAFAVYGLALQSGLQRRTAFWSGLMMAFCPIGLFGSLFAITDGGLLLFWTLACLTLASALREKKAPNSFLLGCWVLLGALFKWTMFGFWPVYFICYALFFPAQNLWKSLIGPLISLLALLPSFLWNYSHDWATFRHVASTLQGGHGAQTGNFFEFLGMQMLLVSPLLFGLLFFALTESWKGRSMLKTPLIFCAAVTTACLLGVSFMAFFQKVQGNWILIAYPTAFVLIGWYCCEVNERAASWMKGGIGLSLGLVLLVFLLPSFSVPYRINPFKHNLGWTALNKALLDHGYDPAAHFLASDKYQTTSELSFYGKGQKRAYFLNLSGARKNQFSYWPQLQTEEQGKKGFFVWVENAPRLQKDWPQKSELYRETLLNYFQNVESLGLIPLIEQNGEILKGILLFKCENCLQTETPDIDLY